MVREDRPYYPAEKTYYEPLTKSHSNLSRSEILNDLSLNDILDYLEETPTQRGSQTRKDNVETIINYAEKFINEGRRFLATFANKAENAETQEDKKMRMRKIESALDDVKSKLEAILALAEARGKIESKALEVATPSDVKPSTGVKVKPKKVLKNNDNNDITKLEETNK